MRTFKFCDSSYHTSPFRLCFLCRSMLGWHAHMAHAAATPPLDNQRCYQRLHCINCAISYVSP